MDLSGSDRKRSQLFLDRVPYTYVIGWKDQDKWYYGCRYAKGCHPTDLWKTYFTSSNLVKRYREKYGEPTVIQIRKVFESAEKCILWENKVIRKLCSKQDRWLNVFVAPARPPDKCATYGMLGKNHTNETKEKIKQSNVGQKRTKQTCDNIARAMTGKPGNKSMLGRHHTDEAKEKMLIASKKPKSSTMRSKLSATCTGRKRQYLDDGTWTWTYNKK